MVFRPSPGRRTTAASACALLLAVLTACGGRDAGPEASPSTANRLVPASVLAATISRFAVCPSSTKDLVPLSVHASPDFVAVALMPCSSQRPFSSVKATVAMVSPEAMPGSRSFLAASSPEWISVLAASTTDEKYGAHRRARPISSSTTMSSM